MDDERDIVDILLDEEDHEPIVLVDGGGNKVAFEQIAVIPHNDKLYCILKPITHIDNVGEDEAIVFYVEEQVGKDPALMVETNELTVINIFEEYYDLIEEKTKNTR